MQTSAYGAWRSPLSAAELASGTPTIADLRSDGDQLWWSELRPAAGGRTAIVRAGPGGARDVSPPDLDARTRVHEYGGAPFVARGDLLVSSDDRDQRLHRIREQQASPLTAAPPAPRAVRYADGELTPAGDALIAVRERHDVAGEARNELVAIDLADGSEQVLVSGSDFVAAPRLSPTGEELAWLAWDHPDMPWDGAALYVAPYHDGDVGPAVRLGGGEDRAATHPVWLPDGRLVTSLDTDGWWELHVREGDRLRPVSDLGADVGKPHWTFGEPAIAPLPDGRVVAVATDRGEDRLVLIDVADGAVEELPSPYTHVRSVQPTRAGFAAVVASPQLVSAVVTWTRQDGFLPVRTVEAPQLRPEDRSIPERFELPTAGGDRTYAWVHLPRNADHVGPDDERPPLVVFLHGGPTGHRAPTLSPAIAYWTTRGFAVADVNYRGSSGHGRPYRDALRGAWGLHDVADAMAIARALAARGVVDGDRLAIRGGSAGGFTVLAALTHPDNPFSAGTSFFGVADLAALAEHTHKFESRYLDRLVGPYPEAAAVYRERSPLHHLDRLRTPLLVLQGLEDEVVPPAQAERLVAAAAARGVPHAYLAFEGEQHGFRRAENVVTWLESELAFYGQVFGFEPAGDLPTLDLTGSGRPE